MTRPSEETLELEIYKLLHELRQILRSSCDPRRMLIHCLRRAIEGLDVSAGAVAAINLGQTTAELVQSIPDGVEWNLGLLNDYIKGRKPEIPDDMLIARVKRRSRTWAAIALKTESEDTGSVRVKALRSIADMLSERLEAYDHTRIRQIRHRIEQKIANRQHPKDTVYDILHGLRSLIRYDHSASFLVGRSIYDPLELIAEQIAWTKSKSRVIGLKVPVAHDQWKEMADSEVRLFRYGNNGRWQDPERGNESSLAIALDYNASRASGVPRERTMVCALVETPDESIGLLRVTFQRWDGAGEFEAMVVKRFVPLLSLSLQFLLRTQALEEQILQVERRQALVRLSRTIAHDINNALGSILPLVQQMRTEATGNSLQTDVLAKDLQVIESGMQTCRRIFGGMLAFAKSSDRRIGNGNLRRAIDTALSVYQPRIDRQSIELKLSVPLEISIVKGNQGDIESIFYNLLDNSLDAMPDGGRLGVTAREMGQFIEVDVEDTGGGIPEEILDRIMEPWVSTKKPGKGMGLALCRGILWEIGGRISIQSTVGKGTSVKLHLPIDFAHQGNGSRE